MRKKLKMNSKVGAACPPHLAPSLVILVLLTQLPSASPSSSSPTPQVISEDALRALWCALDPDDSDNMEVLTPSNSRALTMLSLSPSPSTAHTHPLPPFPLQVVEFSKFLQRAGAWSLERGAAERRQQALVEKAKQRRELVKQSTMAEISAQGFVSKENTEVGRPPRTHPPRLALTPLI